MEVRPAEMGRWLQACPTYTSQAACSLAQPVMLPALHQCGSGSFPPSSPAPDTKPAHRRAVLTLFRSKMGNCIQRRYRGPSMNVFDLWIHSYLTQTLNWTHLSLFASTFLLPWKHIQTIVGNLAVEQFKSQIYDTVSRKFWCTWLLTDI